MQTGRPEVAETLRDERHPMASLLQLIVDGTILNRHFGGVLACSETIVRRRRIRTALRQPIMPRARTFGSAQPQADSPLAGDPGASTLSHKPD
jgi:hypothetical protein